MSLDPCGLDSSRAFLALVVMTTPPLSFLLLNDLTLPADLTLAMAAVFPA